MRFETVALNTFNLFANKKRITEAKKIGRWTVQCAPVCTEDAAGLWLRHALSGKSVGPERERVVLDILPNKVSIHAPLKQAVFLFRIECRLHPPDSKNIRRVTSVLKAGSRILAGLDLGKKVVKGVGAVVCHAANIAGQDRNKACKMLPPDKDGKLHLVWVE